MEKADAELVEQWTYIETERFRKIFEQRGLENGLLTVGRVIALYRAKIQISNAAAKSLEGLTAQLSELEKSLSFSHGEKLGKTHAARSGASARGEKYSTMKTAALEWYAKERHRFQNKDDAAIEITKTHAVEFSTARGWLKGV